MFSPVQFSKTKELKKIPIKQSWKHHASIPRYPEVEETYTILVKNEPYEDSDQENRYFVTTDKGRIMLWSSSVGELANLMEDYSKDIQVVFFRKEGDRRIHVRKVVEKLEH